jgi:RNA polymerase sigma factor (sigma-70 family)
MAATAESIEELYRSRYTSFRNGMAAVTGSYETARDVVQEAFAQALRDRKPFRGDGSLAAWVWRIAFRIALRSRTNGREPTLGELLEAAPLPSPERDPQLAEALRQLSPQRKLIVFLRYFADLPYADIASLCEFENPNRVSSAPLTASAGSGGTPVPQSSLYTVHFGEIRPGSFVKLGSRNGQVVYAAHRKRSHNLCFLWGPAHVTNFNGSCLAPDTFPSPSRPVWDLSAGYVSVPGLIKMPGLRPGVLAIHYLIGVAADAVRSVQMLAGPDCHPVATVPVINNVYIDVLKPITGEDYIVAREAGGKVVWHKGVNGGPNVPSCGLGGRR